MTFGRRWMAAAVLVPLLVGACSEDPEPKLAPPSASPSTSPTPSAEPTRQPWEKKSNAGAVAFAEHWVDVFNDAQRTGDTTALREISAASCGTCDAFVDMLEELYRGGGSLESRGWVVRQSVASRGLPNGRGRVSLRVARSAQVVRHGDKEQVERFEKSEVTLSARLTWARAGWVMDDLVALE